MNRLELLLIGNSAPHFEDHVTQRGSHGHFHQADIVHIAGYGKHLCALAGFGPHTGVPGAAIDNNLRHIRKSFHIVQNGRLVPESFMCRKGWARPGHSPLALDGTHQRGFLATNKGAGALIDFNFKIKPGSENILTQETVFFGLLNGDSQSFDGQRVFGSGIYISFMGVDGFGCDDHPFYDSMGIGFEDTPIHKGSRIPLIRIAQDVFHVTGAFKGKFPFDTGGEAGAPPASQTG